MFTKVHEMPWSGRGDDVTGSRNMAVSVCGGAGAIQCFSCKATASNEIEANIRCLEKANLEDCSEFYEYYRSVSSC